MSGNGVKNVSVRGAILPVRFDINETVDDNGTPGVAADLDAADW